METNGEIRAFLLDTIQKWLQLELTDLVKLLYQAAFGCGHFAPSEERVMAYLREELDCTQANPSGALVEPILGGYARVHIAPYAAQEMDISRSAAQQWLEQGLVVAQGKSLNKKDKLKLPENRLK